MEELGELKKKYLNQLACLFNDSNESLANKDLKEYFESMSNSLESDEHFKNEQMKLSKLKSNEKQLELAAKTFKTNWNLDYCEYCKIAYWPSNCRVYMLPKLRLTAKNSHILAKHKLFDYKPKYKSYKDKLLNKIMNKGVKLVYECKRCKSKNLIFDETKRQTKFRYNKKLSQKNVSIEAIHSVTLNKNSATKKPVLLNRTFEETTVIVSKSKAFAGRKKFQSLQIKLKQNEIEQENLKKRQSCSLSDFLQKLT